MIFLDSNAIISLLKGEKEIGLILKKRTDSLAITSLNFFEIKCGLEYYRLKGYSSSEERLLSKLNLFKQFELTSQASLYSAKIWAELKVSGKMIKTIDLLIAGTILSNGYSSILSNNKHFDQINGITRISY